MCLVGSSITQVPHPGEPKFIRAPPPNQLGSLGIHVGSKYLPYVKYCIYLLTLFTILLIGVR